MICGGCKHDVPDLKEGTVTSKSGKSYQYLACPECFDTAFTHQKLKLEMAIAEQSPAELVAALTIDPMCGDE